MTVRQLIRKLEELPPNATVIYSLYSEYEKLDESDIRLIKAEEQKLFLHQGRYLRWHPSYKKPDPKFVTACVFPGN